VPADRVLKTLMIEAGGKAVCAVIASNQDVSMKRLAAALGAKSAAMMKPAAAERLTGYHVGGVSPLGQKKVSPVVIDVAAMDYDRVFVNGGQRGLQVHLSPRDLAAALSAVVTDIKAI
jgi:Cys-tRNA(Pro)/Cys-tRNA(Cys) deacylase